MTSSSHSPKFSLRGAARFVGFVFRHGSLADRAAAFAILASFAVFVAIMGGSVWMVSTVAPFVHLFIWAKVIFIFVSLSLTAMFAALVALVFDNSRIRFFNDTGLADGSRTVH